MPGSNHSDLVWYSVLLLSSLLLGATFVKPLNKYFEMAELEQQQLWKVINLDKRENLHPGDVSGHGEIFASGYQLVELLKNPTWLKFKIPSAYIRASKHKSLGSPLIVLPQEIIDQVAKNLSDDGDRDAIVCLALSCTYFFRLLANKMQKAIHEDVGQWRKDRLMFIAPSAPGFPQNVGTADEEAEWNQLEASSLYNLVTEPAHTSLSKEGPLQRRMTYRAPELFQVDGRQIARARDIMKKCNDIDSLERFGRLLKHLMKIPKSLKWRQCQAVLRNLDTKEYIRGHPLAVNQHPRNLGEALICFLMWSGDTALDPNVPVAGRWVGHRFDISMAVTVEGDEWTDVTQEALNRLSLSCNERIYWFLTRRDRIFPSEMAALAVQMGMLEQ